MKGKRKVKTLKWQNAASMKAQARCRLGDRTMRASRFLDLALFKGRESEPVGLLAGSVGAARTIAIQWAPHVH